MTKYKIIWLLIKNMDKIIKFNREVIKKIDNFIDDSDYEKRDDLYGLPRHVSLNK